MGHDSNHANVIYNPHLLETSTDRRQIAMTAQDEKGRLAEFFRTEYRKLLGFVKRRVDDIAGQDAEDFIHDVAVHLFDRADIAYPIEHLSAYVYRALQNRITDYFRRRRPMAALEENETGVDDLNSFGKIRQDEYVTDSDIRQMEISHDLSRLMDKLNDDEKKLIIATEIKGQTFRYLSRIWNVPINTLLSRKSRAMAKIRKETNKKK